VPQSYSVRFTSAAQKQLSKLDPAVKRGLIAWIEENLEDCCNPEAFGGALSGSLKGLWKYRVGNYRIVSRIIDNQIMILVVTQCVIIATM